MAITRDSTLDLDQLGTRVRILTGIESTEIDDSNLSEIISMAMEWFEEQTGLTYAVDTDNSYDNAVIFYSCYLTSMAQNGMGMESLKIGDVFIQYNDKDLMIGHETIYQTGDSAHMWGYLDEIRISKGIARWTSNFDDDPMFD